VRDDRIPFPPDSSSDPDGFDAERRRDVVLRLATIEGQHDRERRIATMTPLQIAESDLAAMRAMQVEYLAGRTTFPVTASNTAAMAEHISQLAAKVAELRRQA
jgi:hypothetical protein